MSIEIKFPERLNSIETQVYVITETRIADEEYDFQSGEVEIKHERRNLGTVYFSPLASSLPYTERIAVNQHVYPIGRKGSLLSAISGLVAFHKLTGYQHAPWEVE